MTSLNQIITESYLEANIFGLDKKRPKLSDVIAAPTEPAKLPEWILRKKYVTENVDALKYEPAILAGALVRMFPDGSFQDYATTYNVKDDNFPPEMIKVETPSNFYEEVFDSNTSFNANFVIGGLSIAHDEVLKITYTETNYAILKKYDHDKIEKIRAEIEKHENAQLSDWALVRGVVILDCTYNRNKTTSFDANLNANWVSLGGKLFKQEGNTNNFRLVSIELEPLFLVI